MKYILKEKKMLQGNYTIHGDNQKSLAKDMGITTPTLNNKIHSRYGASFSGLEVDYLKARYGFTDADIEKMFEPKEG